jgi:hypothetical protein
VILDVMVIESLSQAREGLQSDTIASQGGIAP